LSCGGLLFAIVGLNIKSQKSLTDRTPPGDID
jgi:hypothetical protein